MAEDNKNVVVVTAAERAAFEDLRLALTETRTPLDVIRRFRCKEDAEDPRWKGTAKRVFRGMCEHKSFGDTDIVDRFLGADWIERIEWRDGGYRSVWVNSPALCIVTYCEHDISVVLCDTEEAFAKELKEAGEFYATH